MNNHEMQTAFVENGWLVLDSPSTLALKKGRAILEDKLRELCGRSVKLEEYHLLNLPDEQHTDLQIQLNALLRNSRLIFELISPFIPLFTTLLGPDLSLQNNPHLRIGRPERPQDQVGFHRDTFYGGTPYEISCVIPFVDVPEGAALHVLDGSHLTAEGSYPLIERKTGIERGSPQHKIGFPYFSKIIAPSIETQMHPVPLRMGQILVFSLATVHGSKVNSSSITRWSTDARVLNTFAPLAERTTSLCYEEISTSVMTRCARLYYERTAEEARKKEFALT